MAGRSAIGIRYALQTLHILLILLLFLFSILLAFNIIYTILIAAALVALLVYIPASIVLTAQDSKHGFQSAGGEVGYLVVQMVLWLVSAIWATIVRAISFVCVDGQIFRGVRFIPTVCNFTVAIAVLSYLHFIMLTLWMAWLIHTARRTSGRTASEAFRLPAHRLLSGEVGGSMNGTGGREGTAEMGASRSVPMAGRVGQGVKYSPVAPEPYAYGQNLTVEELYGPGAQGGAPVSRIQTEQSTQSWVGPMSSDKREP